MAIVKCPYCQKQFNREKEPFYHLGNRYYHLACWNKINTNEQIEKNDYEDLWQYCKQLFGADYNYTVFKREIEKLHSEYPTYSNSGILKSLKWFYEIKNGKILDNVNRSLGIIPYIYEEAQKYYYSIYLINKENNEKEVSYEEETIEIISPRVKKKLPKLFFEGEDE